MSSLLYTLIIYPLEMFIESVFSISMEMIPAVGYAIVFVSIAVQVLALPMYKRADQLQNEERDRQKAMEPTVRHIKKTFKGDERVMMLSTYYREEHYHSYYQFKVIMPLLLQIPFFMAAYNFLSGCSALDGASFYFLKDLGRPDGMITVGGISINVMPVIMTAINILSGAIYTKGYGIKEKLQLYLTAGVFLVLLYNSPSGLVFYWTLNNLFSLVKNIFMKIVKQPRPIIGVLSLLFVCAYCFKCYTYGRWSEAEGRITMIMILLIGALPLLGLLFDKVRKNRDEKDIAKEDKSIFLLSSIVTALTVGALIPIVTIASSPAEFVVRGYYVNPMVHVIYPFITAIGIFVLWGNILLAFNSERSQKVMCFAMFGISACVLVNSQFFKKNLNNMSVHMQYNRILDITTKQKLINIGVLIALLLVCYGLYKYTKRTVMGLCISLIAVVVFMTGYNTVKIQRVINNTAHIKDNEYYTQSDAHFTLDKSGDNVVVIMLDRALGQYVPYIFNERPELADVFSGFTFYPNTITYGPHTLTGAPALMGGYEYTTYNMKDMVGDEYTNFRLDSINVMPKIFSDNGYKCSVLDPPIDPPNKELESYYNAISSDIDAFYADGVTKTEEEARSDYEYFSKISKKTYIKHSLFLSSPQFLRLWVYDNGKYHMQTKVDERLTLRSHIGELDKLSEMTSITDNGKGTFSFICNLTPHCINADLQMPNYTIEDEVDNSPFLDEWRNKLETTPGDRKINMYTDWAIQSYEVNMTCYLRLAKWIKYLKDNDLYDNTRIILVSDHGFYYFAFDDMMFDKGSGVIDLERMTPLLMVKDFGDGQFTTSDEFMTNADVPTIAMRGLIEDPVNPNTGKPITDAQKFERVQYVYDDDDWLSVHDDVYDLNNWKVEEIEFKNKELMMSD